jgi:uncharacterized protein (TIGR02246 family)
MKKLSVLVAGAALSAIAVGATAPVTTAASAPPVAAASHGKATDRGGAPSEANIAALFDRWNTALGSGDPEKVAALYAPDAVLLPTASPQIRTTHAEIVDYFEHFLQRKPVGTKLRTVVEVLDSNTAIDTGVYRFTLTNADGTTQDVDARYTYVYEKRDGNWWIVNHHSSVLPPAS